MNQAAVQHLRFGSELIFTYGPYAAVQTHGYHPQTDLRTLLAAIQLVSCLFVVLTLLAKGRLPAIWLVGTVGLSLPVLQQDALSLSYPLTFLAWWMTRSQSAHTEPLELMTLAYLMIPLGLLPLVKGSLIVMCAGVVILCALFACIQRDWRGLAILLIGPVLSACVAWVLSGQALGDLARYFRSMLPIVSGYTEAMSVQGRFWDIVYFVIPATLMTGYVFTLRACPPTGRVLLAAGYGAFLLLCFKGGFTRHDAHALWAASGLVIAAAVLAMIDRGNASAALLVIGLACAGAIAGAHYPLSVQGLIAQGGKALRDASQGAWTRISRPEAFPAQHDRLQEAIRKSDPLPTLAGTTDIYSFDQHSLIASGNAWSPRPILQSYSVYSDELAEINRLHLVGPRAPDHLIVRIQPIDGRLPTLEDGPSWIEFLRRYDLASAEKSYLLLKRRSEPIAAEPVMATRMTGHLGEQLQLGSLDGIVFCKIRIQPTLQGRLLRLFYKPSRLEIKLTLQSGQTRMYRLIAGMASSGFLLSPFVESEPALASLLTGASLPAGQRVQSIQIVATDRDGDWKRDVEFELWIMQGRSPAGDASR